MAEFLLELLCEEIPARMQIQGAREIATKFQTALDKAGLTHGQVCHFSTPRRLVLVIDDLITAQPDNTDERRGPKIDAPEQAINGFLKSVGLTRDQVEERETKKGTFLFAEIHTKGRLTADVLAELCPEILTSVRWPKSMRWGSNAFTWVRPVHSIVAVLAGDVVNFEFAGVRSGNLTVGHRFLNPEPITVTAYANYQEKLKSAHVIVDQSERCKMIKNAAEKQAATNGLALKVDVGLLNDVTGLVEWPVALIGAIDDAFMDLPVEVLETSMKKNQFYFSCLDQDGKLANRFIVVAATEAADGGKKIVEGNERVLRARLADARFFWDQDRKQTLSSRTPALQKITFHAKLGTLDEKTDRVQSLAVEIAAQINGADRDLVRSAARLAKADLTTGMVGEFANLQGVMGRYYALKDGEKVSVANAIQDHYAPAGPDDYCPSAPVSMAVAMADKIDTLCGFWSIDEKPTGSKDPFALRRQALGVIRIIMENKLNVSLLPWFEKSTCDKDISLSLLAFFADRLKVHLKNQGVRHDHIDAIFKLKAEDNLLRLLARVDALSKFLETNDGDNLLTAYRRAANILRIEEKKDGVQYGPDPDTARFKTDEERRVFAAIEQMKPLIEGHLEGERFTEAMAELASLRGPVDIFFDDVIVNDDDVAIRNNRLKLLSCIRSALDGVADFASIEG